MNAEQTTILYKYIVEYRNKSYHVDYITDDSGECVKVDILNESGEVEDDNEIYKAIKLHLDRKRAPFRSR